MSIPSKSALPSNLADEGRKFQDLFLKGSTRTTSGNLVYISTTSSTTYNTATGYGGVYANQGETGLMNMLKNEVLSTYIVDDTWISEVVSALQNTRKFITVAGTANAITVNTGNIFDITGDGNSLKIKPILTNTDACTIAVDGGSAKAIKKFDTGTDAYIDVVAGDIKKNHNVELRYDLGNGFFVL